MDADFRDDYDRGMVALFDYAPFFGRLARNLGQPIPDTSIPTAMVEFNPATKKVSFVINPDYIRDLTDEQVAFVIAHETYHVLLNHLSELTDTDLFPDRGALATAHELIINDTIDRIMALEFPDNLYHGSAYNQDFSVLSSIDAYKLLAPETDDEDEADSDAGGPSAQGSGDSGQNPASGQGSAGESTDSNGQGAGDKSDEKDQSNGDSGSDDEQSESGEESTEDSSDESGSDDSQDSETDDDKGDQGSGDANTDDQGSEDAADTSKPQACGGFRGVDEDSQDDFSKAVAKALSGAINDAQKNNETVSDEVLNAAEDVADEAGVKLGVQYGIGNNTGSTMFTNTVNDMNLDWKELLAKINPKVMTAGTKKRRGTSFHSPRRRMMSSYPKVILPVEKRSKDMDGKGNELPTVILALDLSYSIPEYLIAGLASLADSMPTDLFDAIPVTWSDYVKEFDTNTRQIVPRSGTNIDAVYKYSQEVAKRIGKQPYVVLITDGEFSFGYNTDAEVVKKFWYWGAIDDDSLRYIKSQHNGRASYYSSSRVDYLGDSDNVFNVNDFLQK